MPIKKITDPAKKTTDPVLLSHLAKMGIDPNYVEFADDYGALVYKDKLGRDRRNYYSKRYRDLKSNKIFLVLKGLPMCRADGIRLTPGWIRRGGKFHAKTNLFTGTVEDERQITLSPTNDQPNGMLASDILTWNPQIYLGGIEVSPVAGPTLLSADPINPNYQNNVIEWDYGPCRRRVRTIEGQVQERWIFDSNPGADIRIVHNHTGKGLKLGIYAIDDDVEFIPLAAFQQATYPFEISAGGTFYPDEHEETSSADGYTARVVAAVWATLEAGAGTFASDSTTDLRCFFLISNATPDKWTNHGRSITVFDASAASGDISAVSLSFCGFDKVDQCNITPAVNVYSANPASNIAIIAADHTTLGTTAFSDANITYAAWSVAAGYNNVYDFNAAGIAAVQAAVDGDGIVKLGQRDAIYDVGASTPTHPGSSGLTTYMRAYAADQGSGFEPKLIIETGLPDIEESIDVTLEVEAAVGKSLTFPITPTIEPEASLERKLGFPLSALVEVEAEATLHIGLFKSISVTLEVEAETGKSLTFPLSPTIEVEAVAGKHLIIPITPTINVGATLQLGLTKALSALIEVEAAGGKILTFPITPTIEVEAAVSYKMGLEKSISALIEVEAEAGRLLIFPLSALIEVDVFAGHCPDIYKAISALLEVEADLPVTFIWSFIKDHQILLDIWGSEHHIH